MDFPPYYPIYRNYITPPNISDAGNIWTDGPTQQGIIVYSIVTPIICLCGIFGNTISLVVLCRRELKGSIYVYLSGASQGKIFTNSLVLAFVDLCRSILLFISGLCSGVLYLDDWPIYDVLFGLPLASISNTMCVLTTFMVTLDRILYLANPLTRRKPKLCHAYVARRIMVVCFIVSAAMNIPYFFIFESDEQGQVRTRAFYYSNEYNCYNWVRFIILGVMPSIFLTFGNGYLIHALRKMKKIKAKCNSFKGKKPSNYYVNLTVILILIVFFFLISEIPTLLTNRAAASTFFFFAHDSDDSCNSKWLETVRQISTIICAISLAADFVLYYLFCPPFCKILSKLLRRKKRSKSVQMNVFVLDKQICFDKNIKSIRELTAGKLLQMMDVEGNRDSLPSSLFDGSCHRFEEGEVKVNRDTLITLCSNANI